LFLNKLFFIDLVIFAMWTELNEQYSEFICVKCLKSVISTVSVVFVCARLRLNYLSRDHEQVHIKMYIIISIFHLKKHRFTNEHLFECTIYKFLVLVY
jgi:hypothetical protein